MKQLLTCLDCKHVDVKEIEYSKYFDNVVCMGCTKNKFANGDLKEHTPWFDVDNPKDAICSEFEMEEN